MSPLQPILLRVKRIRPASCISLAQELVVWCIMSSPAKMSAGEQDEDAFPFTWLR